MVVAPAATAVTSPVGDTVATAGFSEAHCTGFPARALPLASRTSAVACVVWPVLSADSPSDTETTAAVALDPGEVPETVTFASPFTDPTAAQIVTVPVLTAVTRPVVETVATATLSDDHVTV